MFDLQKVIKLLNYAVMLVLKRLHRFLQRLHKGVCLSEKREARYKKRLSLCDGLYRGEKEWVQLGTPLKQCQNI